MSKTTLKGDKETIDFIEEKKREMKKSQYRQKFDALAAEINQNLNGYSS